MKLTSREDAQGRRLKNFVQIRSVSSVDIRISHGQIFIGDEEFVILVTFEPQKDPGFSFPCEANPEF